MKATSEPTSYGEPWLYDRENIHAGTIATLHGQAPGWAEIWSMTRDSAPDQHEMAKRAIQCVNACAGIADPEAAIKDARHALIDLEHAACLVALADNSDANPDAVRLRSALGFSRAALAKLSVILALAFILPSCLTGRLARVEEPTFQALNHQGEREPHVSPFATAVLTDGRTVDILPDQAARLRQFEGQTVTLPWIP